MVPVPEELAPKVLSYVNWKGHPRLESASNDEANDEGATPRPPDGAPPAAAAGGGPLARAYAGLDAASRALVDVIATAALDEEQLTVPTAARRAGMGTREALGTILELTHLIVGEGGPPMAILVTDVEGAAEVEFSWDQRIFAMSEPIAREFATLARA